MADCPHCGATVGSTQRRCRACGGDLDHVHAAGGLLGRFGRWLSGLLCVRVGTPRVTVSTRVTMAGEEPHQDGPADQESFSLELAAAVEEARKTIPGEGTTERVISAGPVNVTTRTVTRTYRSLDEMPPELRQRAEAAMREAGARSATAITVDINGRRHTYRRIEDVPEPYRQALHAARAKAGQP